MCTSSIAPIYYEKGLNLNVIPGLRTTVLQLAPTHIVPTCESSSLVLVDSILCIEAWPIFFLEINANVLTEINLLIADKYLVYLLTVAEVHRTVLLL